MRKLVWIIGCQIIPVVRHPWGWRVNFFLDLPNIRDGVAPLVLEFSSWQLLTSFCFLNSNFWQFDYSSKNSSLRHSGGDCDTSVGLAVYWKNNSTAAATFIRDLHILFGYSLYCSESLLTCFFFFFTASCAKELQVTAVSYQSVLRVLIFISRLSLNGKQYWFVIYFFLCSLFYRQFTNLFHFNSFIVPTSIPCVSFNFRFCSRFSQHFAF